MLLLTTILSIVSVLLSILLYQQAGESCSVFILAVLGLFQPEIGQIVSPCVILYFCIRNLLL